MTLRVLHRWEEYQVHDILQFTLVAMCHASIDAEMAVEMHDFNALETLFQTLSVLPERLNDYVPFVLETCRNLCGSDAYSSLPTDFVQSLWEILLSNEVTCAFLSTVRYKTLILRLLDCHVLARISGGNIDQHRSDRSKSCSCYPIKNISHIVALPAIFTFRFDGFQPRAV